MSDIPTLIAEARERGIDYALLDLRAYAAFARDNLENTGVRLDSRQTWASIEVVVAEFDAQRRWRAAAEIVLEHINIEVVGVPGATTPALQTIAHLAGETDTLTISHPSDKIRAAARELASPSTGHTWPCPLFYAGNWRKDDTPTRLGMCTCGVGDHKKVA